VHASCSARPFSRGQHPPAFLAFLIRVGTQQAQKHGRDRLGGLKRGIIWIGLDWIGSSESHRCLEPMNEELPTHVVPRDYYPKPRIPKSDNSSVGRGNQI
jgi:hypothetical protein